MNRIAKVGPEFATQLVDLWIATFEQAYADWLSVKNIEAYCSKYFTLNHATAELSDDDTVCCAYYKGRRPTGFYIVKHHDCPFPLDGGSSELKQIYILATEYGSGAARSLLRHAYESVCAKDNGWIWLTVADANHRALSFYRKNRFSPRGPVQHLKSAQSI